MSNTISEIVQDIEQYGFKDPVGNPLGMCKPWMDMRERLADMPVLYTVEDGWVELHSGTRFEYRNPQPSMIHIEDIGNALGKVTRYAGHTHTFYSVAEHSCLMMRYARDKMDLRADRLTLLSILMHDAAEAYMPDLPRPLKYMMPAFRSMEADIEAVIAAKFGFPNPQPRLVKHLDTRILCDERAQAMNPSDNEWGIDSLDPLGVDLHFWSPDEAISNFLGDFKELMEPDGARAET